MNRLSIPYFPAQSPRKTAQVFANNLANVNTAGFKQDQQGFAASWPVVGSVGMGSRIQRHHLDDFDQTGRPHRACLPKQTACARPSSRDASRSPAIRLDLAIQTDGFFEVKTPDGVRYTRNGIFSSMANDVWSPIWDIRSWARKGDQSATRQHSDQRRGRHPSRWQRDRHDQGRRISPNEMPQKFAEGLFTGGKPSVSKKPQLQSGHIEESNVNSLSEMVKMIQGMRSYESAQKLIQTLDHMTDTAIQDLGRCNREELYDSCNVDGRDQ